MQTPGRGGGDAHSEVTTFDKRNSMETQLSPIFAPGSPIKEEKKREGEEH